ncbi:hypothetical protein DRO61_04515 [Candidatus Bathyarchaeota archaeon]|nr:MAG: hypothetical protein DRO61_04515 [Candidatus Bathyarchaeota archaeon]
MKSRSQCKLLLLILFVNLFSSVISTKADSESYWLSNWEKNDIKRLSSGATGYEGYEINRPAVLNGEVYYLYQRPTSRPVNSFLRYYDIPVFTFMNEYGLHPQTFWMHYKLDDEILWVGQILQLNSFGDILYLPAATVLLNDTDFYEAIIPDTVNSNELIGVCYYNGKWYAGERSGDTFNHKTPTYPRGGGLWESTDGINWVRHTSPEMEDPINLPYGRELLLATLNGHLYGFYQGSSSTKTLIRRLNTNENISESPSLNQGLVPFQIHDEGFDWKGYIPLRTGEDLGWFDGNTLKFQHFGPIEGREVRDAIPIGLYENNLIITVRSGNEYTVLSLSEPFGEPIKIAANWMEGWGVRGTIDGDYAYLGVLCPGYSALDRILLTENEESPQILFNDYEYWVDFVNENEANGKEWYIDVPYTWWHGLSKVQLIGRLMNHITKQDEPLWIMLKDEADASLYVKINKSYVSDERADLGSVQTVGFHAIWANNGSNVNRGHIFINGTEYVTNGTGWITFTDTSSTVQKKTWRVTDINYYGITRYVQTVVNPNIIWDRVNIILSMADTNIDVKSNATINWTGVYEYDMSIFRGSITLNSTQTLHNSVGKRGYTVLLIEDPAYGLTSQTSNDIYGIWNTSGVPIVKIWLQWWFWIIIGSGMILILAVYLFKRKSVHFFF